MLILGAIIGIVFGGAIITLTAPMLGIALTLFGPLAVVMGPLVAFFAPLLGVVGFGAAFAFTFATVFIVVAIAYIVAALSLLPSIGGAPNGAAPNPLAPVALELLMRGLHMGLNATLNYALLTWITGNPILGLIVGVINLLAAIPGVSAVGGYQTVLGWTSWIMPMSYFVMPLGILLFIINLPFALATFGTAALRFDVTTSTFETTGGAIVMFLAGFGSFTPPFAFNLGNFSFLVPATGTLPPAIQTPFTAPGLSAHETGHTLQVAGFGGFHGWMNALDENVLPGRFALAYGEMIVESHLPRNGLFHVLVWS